VAGVVRTLQEHQIIGRVLAVTTDNASNKATIVAAVNDTFQALKQTTDSAIIQIPCIAYVIQLSLNDLLGKIKASPKNDTVELEWKDDVVRALCARQHKQEIAATLNKDSCLTIYYTKIILISMYFRLAVLLFISMQALNVVMLSLVYSLINRSLCLFRMYEAMEFSISHASAS
jgi:hypothetical protein